MPTSSGTDLSEANLFGANLSEAILTETNFSGAFLWGTIFGDADLKGAKGLDTCEHAGPSTIDHRTLAKSGTLPLPFLRGVGLPGHLIDYLPSPLGEAIQFYACFFSYARQDQPFAERPHAHLQNKSVRCWYAPEDIQDGKRIHEQIDEPIRVNDKLVLILSRAGIGSSSVEHELRRARRREVREGRRVLSRFG
jgi:hypothetical protein